MAKKPPQRPTGKHGKTSDGVKGNEQQPENSEPTIDDIQDLGRKIGESFSRIIDDDVDEDDFGPRVDPYVETALQRFTERNELDLADNPRTHVQRFAAALKPRPSQGLAANEPYRQLVREGHYRFSGNPVPFEEYRSYEGKIDAGTVEKLFRRVDAEVRNLDIILREELIHNFVNVILGFNFGVYHHSVSADFFQEVSPSSQALLRDLTTMYLQVSEHAEAIFKGVEKLRQEFNQKSIDQLIEVYNGVGSVDYPMRVEYSHITRVIRPAHYYMLLQLTVALTAALPLNVRESLEAVLESEYRINPVVAATRVTLLERSKYLRNAFIAISQGHGSFEAFFVALNEYQGLLDKELNDRVAVARHLVNTYDVLGLGIAEVLRNSVKRILNEPPF